MTDKFTIVKVFDPPISVLIDSEVISITSATKGSAQDLTR